MYNIKAKRGFIMKKNIRLLSVLFLTTMILGGCNPVESSTIESTSIEEITPIDIILPQGTPLIAVGNLLDNPNYNFEIVSGPDSLTAAMTAKTHDIVIAPITAGAKLYIKNASTYLLDSVITTNNTYIISKGDNTLNSIADLEGKDIIGYSQGNTPA